MRVDDWSTVIARVGITQTATKARVKGIILCSGKARGLAAFQPGLIVVLYVAFQPIYS